MNTVNEKRFRLARYGRKTALRFCSGIVLCLLPAAASLLSCGSIEIAEQRLQPPRSTANVRLNDIRNAIPAAPEMAVHLIGVYRAIYGDDETLVTLLDAATEQMKRRQEAALEEKRYDDAASLARSLRALSVNMETTREEDDFLLASAMTSLEKGENLQAFLSAFASDRVAPLTASDALPFLERAVEVRQRRSAAFFLGVMDKDGAAVDRELRAFAQGRDSAAQMVKGVATVVVDRGIRVARGMGYPDRVLGSAFFVDTSGLLITNYHVIESEVSPSYEGYSRLYIRMGDSTSARIPAKVVGYDKTLDLAVIKAEIAPEYVFSLIDRAAPEVGETVLAIGSPGGLEKTVTSGIVSALGRRFLQIGDVIQIDAAINHGNSGGPVVDTEGRLVGIVFAGVEEFEGLNFAIPAERLASALPAMLKGGKAERPWLGFSLAETKDGVDNFIEIVYVAPLTPAWEQGIRENTLITKLNGETVTAPEGLLITAYQDALFFSQPGELCAIETADGRTFCMTLAARPELPLAEAAKVDSKERMAAPLFGMVLAPSIGGALSPTYLIKKVIRGSIADEIGLSPEDPVTIKNLKLEEKQGYATMEIAVKKKRQGYLGTVMILPAYLDSPDTL
ncbi:MAG: trypsin-like peptidase domain-containing protein [Spirochaetaceae bacterium]|jgi:S1-C subfamily serine protease|nr:trypsin-like peptidase domain-containing protein [Spirochaetaceae bacterium]